MRNDRNSLIGNFNNRGGNIVSDKTEINSDIRQATVVNPDLAGTSCKLSAGSIIAGKYEVIEPLSVSTGEADLYICKYNGKE